jgi:hypothetical protein
MSAESSGVKESSMAAVSNAKLSPIQLSGWPSNFERELDWIDKMELRLL